MMLHEPSLLPIHAHTSTHTAAFRVTPSDIVAPDSAVESAPSSTEAPTSSISGRRHRQLTVTRAATTSSGGCDGKLPLLVETADAAAAQAAIAALQAILSGATPLMDAGGAPLDASLLCEMEYETTLVYEPVRFYNQEDALPMPAAAAAGPSDDAASPGTSGVHETALWGAVGGGVGAAVVTGTLVLVGVSMRRLLSRSDRSWDVTPDGI